MSRRDGTGPDGYGAKTGWRQGHCVDKPISRSRTMRGAGRARGWRWRNRVPVAHGSLLEPEEEVYPGGDDALRKYASRLRKEADAIERDVAQRKADDSQE